MNRSILIVIVDFLLISLVVFSKPELDLKSDRAHQAPTFGSLTANRQDLTDTLKLSLEKERESRLELNAQLNEIQTQLQTKEQALGDRDQLMREAEQLLRQKAEEAAKLARDRAALEQQYKLTRSNIADLQKQLESTLTEATTSKQRLEETQTDLQAREQEQGILQRKIAELEKSRLSTEAEKQRLATQLQIAETETRLVHEQLDSVKNDVQAERQEKAKLQEHATQLAQGVTALAEKSGELTKEIRENRPLAPNTVFNEFVTNRIRVDFRAVRSGAFGREINREKEFKTVLMRRGDQIYAVYHVNDTPLSLSTPGIDWDWLIGNLRRGPSVVRIDRISLLAADPRVVVVPVSEVKAQDLNAKIYEVPKDPFKFQDAILVGANEGYYGECKFQMDVENPQYIRMQRERFSWLVGKFTPSSGDLVFTKGGELLGLMVNKEYCLLLTELAPAYNIQMGIGIGDQQTGLILAQCYSQVARLPFKLQ